MRCEAGKKILMKGEILWNSQTCRGTIQVKQHCYMLSNLEKITFHIPFFVLKTQNTNGTE